MISSSSADLYLGLWSNLVQLVKGQYWLFMNVPLLKCLCFLYFGDRVSLCSLGRPRTCRPGWLLPPEPGTKGVQHMSLTGSTVLSAPSSVSWLPVGSLSVRYSQQYFTALSATDLQGALFLVFPSVWIFAFICEYPQQNLLGFWDCLTLEVEKNGHTDNIEFIYTRGILLHLWASSLISSHSSHVSILFGALLYVSGAVLNFGFY